MINVQEIRRNVINVVKNYSDAQVKVRKATSNEPWGPSSTLMGEIADLTYNVVAFSEIMQIIWKRLNDHGKNWRHVYKALLLLEYLIKTGSEKVAQQCRDNLFAIQTLKDFQYFEENKDQGLSIREKSKLLVNLLKDEEKLKTERIRALKAKERFAQSLSMSGGPSLESSELPKTSSSYHESLSAQGDCFAANSKLNAELENARPQTVGEEELQLQLALAMSKEEAEQEERQRKNDDLRLKMAIEESEKLKANGIVGTSSRSAVDALLSLSTPMPVKSELVPTDPWGSPLNNRTLLPSPPNKSKQPDPWGAPSSTTVASFDTNKSTFDDPWASQPTRPAINDPWGAGSKTNTALVPKNDPWNLTSNGIDSNSTNAYLGDIIEPAKVYPSLNDSIRRTPESFLGSNSNLVNLDALVSNKQQTSTSPNNNPFAAAVVVAPSNPFQTNKPSQPTINQLRAQSGQLGTGPVSYSNASALDSLFSSASVAPTALPSAQSNFASSSVSSGGSAWAAFSAPPQPQSDPFVGTFATTSTTTSPQQNNPFAM